MRNPSLEPCPRPTMSPRPSFIERNAGQGVAEAAEHPGNPVPGWGLSGSQQPTIWTSFLSLFSGRAKVGQKWKMRQKMAGKLEFGTKISFPPYLA